MIVEEKIKSLGLFLPSIAIPLASYIPSVKSGSLVFTAGQLPIVDGKLVKEGKVGRDITTEDASKLAEICALNALAAITLVATLDQVERIVKVSGFVNCAPGFTEIPGVVNGASEFLIKVFGDAIGKHVRTSIGVAELPLNAPVEIELVVQLRN
jgi:enamine deaminase RidA (YjgF/YER057c/UK114 family)